MSKLGPRGRASQRAWRCMLSAELLEFAGNSVQSSQKLSQRRQALRARITARGFAAATRSKARAGPAGTRRPCSQFRSVATLTPMSNANSACDLPRLWRMARTSSGLKTKARDARRSPRRIAPACLILLTKSSKSFCLTRTPGAGATAGPGPLRRRRGSTGPAPRGWRRTRGPRTRRRRASRVRGRSRGAAHASAGRRG